MKLQVRGTWPGEVVLRQGWAKAAARPWNADIPDAHLRIVRGSVEFLASCSRLLLDRGAPAIVSPPLSGSATRMWRDAGFQTHLHLDLYRRTLTGKVHEPGHDVYEADIARLPAALAIDREAFSELWRMDLPGLRESLAATPRSVLLEVRNGHAMSGFAIVGVAGRTGYLQRVAVEPASEGRGIGRSLVRATLRWAQRRGATAMLLNTQPENDRAAGLYRDESFEAMPSGLTVLRAVEITPDRTRRSVR